MHEKTIAMYIRISLEDGDVDSDGKTESNSIANQRLLLLEYIRSNAELSAYHLEEFCDDGYTGTNFDRPAFQRMIDAVRQRSVHCIIVKDLSRFGREYLDVSSYLERIFPLYNIRFISINDYFDSNDYIGTTGGMEFAFRNLINAMYSKDLSVKAKSARLTRAKRGEYIGGHPFYGYQKDPKDKHRLIVDEEVRPVIERIYDMCISGYSTMAIAKILNEEKIPCPVEYKKKNGIQYNKSTLEKQAFWIQGTVRHILKDERYTGKMISNKFCSAGVGKNTFVYNSVEEWIIVNGTHEAIISEETFQKANIALASRMRVANKNTSWKHSGNLFVCGYCGRKLQKTRGKGIKLYCLKSKYEENALCSGIYEDLQKLQEAVLAALKTMERTLTNGATVVKKKKSSDLQGEKRELNLLEKHKQRIRTEKSRLYESYKCGDISREQFLEMQSIRTEEAAALEVEIAAVNQRIEQQERKEAALTEIQEEMHSVELLTKYEPKVIGRFVEKILVYEGGRIELLMKNRDSYKVLLDNQ